jgi:hypothetical protein
VASVGARDTGVPSKFPLFDPTSRLSPFLQDTGPLVGPAVRDQEAGRPNVPAIDVEPSLPNPYAKQRRSGRGSGSSVQNYATSRSTVFLSYTLYCFKVDVAKVGSLHQIPVVRETPARHLSFDNGSVCRSFYTSHSKT